MVKAAEINLPAGAERLNNWSSRSEKAVRKAMALTMSRFVGRNTEKRLPGLTTEEIYKRSLHGMCGFASALTLAELSKKYPLRFRQFIFLRSMGDDRYPFKPAPINNDKYHAYFLVQDWKGTWFAGSPANYQRLRYDPFDLIISRSLDEVMQKITEKNGGLWPEASVIRQQKKNHFRTRVRALFIYQVQNSITESIAIDTFGITRDGNNHTVGPTKIEQQYVFDRPIAHRKGFLRRGYKVAPFAKAK